MQLGDFIKSERKRLGMTQEDLAKKIKVTSVYVSMLESGRYRAGPKALKAVSRYFDIDIVEVVKMNESHK